MRRGKGLSLFEETTRLHLQDIKGFNFLTDYLVAYYKELIKSSRRQKFCLTVVQSLLSFSSIYIKVQSPSFCSSGYDNCDLRIFFSVTANRFSWLEDLIKSVTQCYPF